MKIQLILSENACYGWHRLVVDALQDRGHSCIITWEQTPAAKSPTGVAALLMLEDTLYGTVANSLTAPLRRQDFPPTQSAQDAPDVAFDLTMGAHAPPRTHQSPLQLQPLFDGDASDLALWDALLDGHTPRLSLVDQHGFIHANGRPAIENPERLRAAARDVLSRLISMIVATVNQPSKAMRDESAPHTAQQRNRRSPMGFLSKALKNKVTRRIRKLTGHEAQWRAAYRILQEPNQRTIAQMEWPSSDFIALPDDRQRYFADPFPVTHEGRHFLFVEEFPYNTGKGILSVAEMKGDGRFSAPHPCLETAVHLSYPQVFRHGENWFMIPESCAANRVDLYRATSFPWTWEFSATLIDNIAASDCTIVRHAGRWWLLGTVTEFGGSSWDCLHAWFADEITGPWYPHPKNPLLIDAECARPAGAVISHNGQLLRPVQNCVGGYGAGLGIAAITQLDENDFQQTVLRQLAPDQRWRASGVHTLNDNGAIEAIDYFA